MIADRPLIETWLAAATLMEHDDRGFILGFPVEQSLYCEGLSRHKDAIAGALTKFAGKPMEVRIELRKGMEAKPSSYSPAGEEEPIPQEGSDSPEPAAAAPPSADDRPHSPEAEANAAPATGETAPDKKSAPEIDPLIQKALEEFEATIIDS